MTTSPAQPQQAQSIKSLETILARMEKTHRQLLEEAENKRKAIVEGDLAALEAIIAREKTLVAEIEKDEGRRLAASHIARRAFGLPEGRDKLSDLAQAAGEPWTGRLETLRTQMKEALTALRAKIRLNQELLKASLDHVAGFMQSIREASGAQTTYTPHARKAQSGGRPLMDTSA